MRTKALTAAGLLAIFFLLVSCEKQPGEPDLTPAKIELTPAASQVISSGNEFGVDLFTKVAETEDRNLMLSPLSASTALTMLLNGCSGNTFTQLRSTLKYPSGMQTEDINEAYKSLVEQLLKADPKVAFSLANAIFYRLGFNVKAQFINSMKENFKAKIEGLDFNAPSALNTINKWASDNTSGKIPKVLDQISDETVMFIMNALYFKGDWSYKFDKSKTTERQFYPDNLPAVNVPTMNGEIGAKVVYREKFRAIEMPYGRTNFTMIVIVPEGGLKSFNSSFDSDLWKSLTSELDEIEEFGKCIVYFPKFKFSYEKILNDQLAAMGMVDAFIPYVADLSGISDAEIFVSFVKQNTFVEVDEEGTEAAAVTTIGMELTSMPPQPQQFVIDRSFIFAIRERTTNTLLFIGQVVNPE
ncbi:MAG TPA: serpin family protein [Bacteroidales bacterium]|nr:serpin family protein [Bacteroidales bacterium]